MADETKSMMLSKDMLLQQIKTSQQSVFRMTKQIEDLQTKIQREAGVAGYAKYLLDNIKLPEKADSK